MSRLHDLIKLRTQIEADITRELASAARRLGVRRGISQGDAQLRTHIATTTPASTIRAWAKTNGHHVNPRGRVGSEVRDAYVTAVFEQLLAERDSEGQ